MKKNLLIVFLTCLACLTGSQKAFALGQDGDGVYQIGNAQDLVEFSNLVASGNGGINAVLTADIDMSGVTYQPAGTVSYAAPEVLAGQIADQRSDIYSLGKVLMRMTSRHKGVLARCTNGNPAKRYASAEKLKAALLRKQRIWPLLLVVLLAVGIAVLALRPSPDAQTPTLPPAVEGAVHDNTTENEAKTAVDEGKTGSRERKPAPAGRPDIGTGDIDAIFNEASDLFE